MRSLTTPTLPAADRPLFLAYLALLLWLPLPIGSNGDWSASLMTVWVLAVAVGWLIQYLRGKVDVSHSFVRAWPVTACLLLTTLWALLQTLPLPANWLGLLSPRSLDIHSLTQSLPTVSLDVHATRRSALKTLCFLLLFCLTLLLINDKQRIKTLARVILIGGVFQAGYGGLMALSGLEYGFFVKKTSGLGVATGTFINPNHLAGYLEICLAAGIGLMLAELSTQAATDWRDRARRLLETLLSGKALVRLALVVMVIGLVLTHSRMGNAAFLISLTAVGTFYLLVIRRITRGSAIFFASLLIIDLLVVGNFFGIEEVAERLQQTSLATEQRDEDFKDTLLIVRDFPLTGSGAGSFYTVYPMYETGPIDPFFLRHAHNDYLQFASEFGLVVLAILAFSVFASIATALRAQIVRRDRLLQGMGFASSMAIVALLVHSAVDFNLQIPANAAMFIVLLALAWVSRYCDLPAMSRESWK